MKKITTEDIAISIAGSKYAIETAKEIIKDWSPNNLRGIFIGLDEKGVFVHTRNYLNDRTKITHIPNEHRSRTISALNILFQRRKYSCLEYFCWDGSILNLGLDPTKTLQYMSKQPLLQTVGVVSTPDSLEDLNSAILRSLGANVVDEVEGLDGVYFQPATYQLDLKIEEKLEGILKSVKDIVLVENEFSNKGIQELAMFRDALGCLNATYSDFHEELKTSFTEALSSHKMGIDKKSLEIVLSENAYLTNNPSFESFIDILGLMDLAFKNGIRENSETVLNLRTFSVSWFKKLRSKLAETLGERLINLYIDEFCNSSNDLNNLYNLASIQERMESAYE